MARKPPNPVDKYVGSRIRLARNEAGLAQDQLADALGVKFQQISKYENGQTRTSVSKMYEIAKLLNVTVPYFFEGMPKLDSTEPFTADVELDEKAAREFAMISRRESVALLKNYSRIEDDELRRSLYVHFMILSGMKTSI